MHKAQNTYINVLIVYVHFHKNKISTTNPEKRYIRICLQNLDIGANELIGIVGYDQNVQRNQKLTV